MTRNLNQMLADVILEAYRHGFSVKSNYAREKAEYVGMAASMGLITTNVFFNAYSREWRPSVTGLQFLKSLDEDDFPNENFTEGDDA